MAEAPLSPTTRYVFNQIILHTFASVLQRISSLNSNNYVNCSALNKTDLKRVFKVKYSIKESGWAFAIVNINIFVW